MKTVAPFLCLLLIDAAWAGTWAIALRTKEASLYIASPQTAWVYRFGAAGKFSVTGLAPIVHNDTNALTGTGSAVMGNDFIHGGNRGTVQGGHNMFSAATHLITPAL